MVVSEQRPKGGLQAGPEADLWGEGLPGREESLCKGPEVEGLVEGAAMLM